MNSVIDENTALIINNLLRELASELDLHYEDEDLRVITPTIERMKTAAQLVVDSGFETPDSYHHILSRYQRVFN